jgi:hypothetical protein
VKGAAGQLAGNVQYGQQAKGIISGATNAGFFDPMGSPMLRAAIRRRALRSAQNRRSAGAGAAQLAGLDPQAARQSFVDTNRGINADTSNFINDAEHGFLMGNQDFARGLFGGRLANEDQIAAEARQAKRERDARGNPLAAGLGTIVGTGLGAATGGYGAALGSRLGR